MTSPVPEDLINTVIAADDLRRKAKGLSSTRAALGLSHRGSTRERILLESFFNVLGHLWACLMRTLPAPLWRSFVQWINTKMGSYSPPAAPELSSRIEEAVRLTKEVKKKTGHWPAFLIFTSHPDTEGPAQWLRFELLRQGLQVADAVIEAENPKAWYPAHPRCFLGIDPYALDTVSSAVAGFYSAWMHQIYVAWDRQPSTQSWLQRHLLLRGTDYSRIAWRLLRYLKKDVPILMALGGGLPYNARLLYAAREFVHRLPVKTGKRKAQLQLMNLLMKPVGNQWPAEKGELPTMIVQQIRTALQEWGISSNQSERALMELQEEFRWPVPYRSRLFRVLMNRLVGRGKPLLLMAVSHDATSSSVRLSHLVALTAVPPDISTFARDFVTANF